LNAYLRKLISLGEGQLQDFKFCITDSRKIAKSLSAFSNSDGGRLLVGVKDNGAIAGVRSDEEFYMIQAAAEVYCKPAIAFETKKWEAEGKVVLEIIVNKSSEIPVLALDHDNVWKAYIRVADQNLLANNVLLKVWKIGKGNRSINIRYTATEEKLIAYLQHNEQITLGAFYKLTHITEKMAEDILAKFVVLGIIEMKCTEKETYFHLKP
jgi:predicted HTH transcriptional regulator